MPTPEVDRQEPVAALRTALADAGLDEVADALGEAIETIAVGAAGKATAPLRTHHQRGLEERVTRESEATLEAFGQKYPDWQAGNDVDKAMAALSQKLPPAIGKDGKPLMTDMEYLESLHALATRDQSPERTRSSGGRQEAPAPVAAPPGAGLRRAYEAAKRGEVWTDAPRPSRRARSLTRS